MRFPSNFALGARRSGVEFGVPNRPSHEVISAYGNGTEKMYGNGGETSKDKKWRVFNHWNHLRRLTPYPEVSVTALSRRKQGFDSPWARQDQTIHVISQAGISQSACSGCPNRDYRHPRAGKPFPISCARRVRRRPQTEAETKARMLNLGCLLLGPPRLQATSP